MVHVVGTWPAGHERARLVGRHQDPDTREDPIRIAFVHSFYSSRTPSGENRVVESEIGALRRAGHDVLLFAAATDDLEREPLYTLRSGVRVATGHGRSPGGIERSRADVVHVHNLFPNWSTAWTSTVGPPVVATMHNFRPMCIRGDLFRAGRPCTLCPDGHRWAGLRYGCYRGSRVTSLPVTVGNRGGPMHQPLIRVARRLVVYNHRSQRLYLKSGVPAERLVVWPNFLPTESDPGPPEPDGRADGWLYVGRLTAEKGIVPLIQRWPRAKRLLVLGDGDQRALAIAAAYGKNIEFGGLASREEILFQMRRHLGLVFLSLWFE